MTSRFDLADPTISTMELWGAEYQESNAALVPAGEQSTRLQAMADREKCAVCFVGEVTDTGKVCCCVVVLLLLLLCSIVVYLVCCVGYTYCWCCVVYPYVVVGIVVVCPYVVVGVVVV